MNQMAKQDIQKVLEETGHQLTLNDVGEVRRLDDLANDVSNAGHCSNKWINSFPRAFGGVVLAPITIAKSLWYDSNVAMWFGSDNGVLSALCMAYVLREDVTISHLAALSDKDEFVKVAKPWWVTIDQRFSELERALVAILPTGNSESVKCKECGSTIYETKDHNYGPIIKLLCTEYGGTPSYWMHEADLIMIENLLNAYVCDQTRQFDEYCQKAKRAGLALPTKPALVSTVKAYREALNELRAKWQTKT